MPTPIFSVVSFGEVLHAVFGMAMVVTALISAAFYYHWGRFAPSHTGAVMTMTAYTVGLFVIVLAMFGVLATI